MNGGNKYRGHTSSQAFWFGKGNEKPANIRKKVQGKKKPEQKREKRPIRQKKKKRGEVSAEKIGSGGQAEDVSGPRRAKVETPPLRREKDPPRPWRKGGKKGRKQTILREISKRKKAIPKQKTLK